jgi:hypothetical protein
MKPLDDFIERLTARLRADKELAAEVGHELRSHIEEAVEEARGDGMNEEEAYQHGLRRFGDPEQIADQLWKANVRRMRLRAVAKWGFRLIAAPAALVLAVVLLWGGLDFPAYVRSLFSMVGGSENGSIASLIKKVKSYEPSLRPKLSTEDAVAYGALKLPLTERAERWVKLFPDKPMFRANRVIAFIAELNRPPRPEGGFPKEVIQEGIALADEGERIDPDNAFFNYMKAVLLMDLSGATELDESSPVTYVYESTEGKREEGDLYHLRVLDPEMFQSGLAEFRKGVAKPRCETYVMPLEKYFLGMERPRRTLLGVAQRIESEAGILLPHLGKFRGMNRIVMAHAADLVERGEREKAADLLAVAAVPATQLGRDTDSFIALLVAMAMRSRALYGAATLYERMGMTAEANAARREADADTGVKVAALARIPGPELEEYEKLIQDYGGAMGRMVLRSVRIDDMSLLKPIRTAERAVAERTVIGIAALILLVEVLRLSIRALLASRRIPRGARSLFIGWRRLAVVLFFGVVAPIGLYVAFSRSPLGSARFGLNAAIGRAVMELGVAMLALLILVNLLGCRAVRLRALEVGVEVPKRLWLRTVFMPALWLFFLGSLVISVSAWYDDVLPLLLFGAGAAVVAFVLLAHFEIRAVRAGGYQTVEGRSLLPVLVATLLLLGLMDRLPIRVMERNSVATLETEGRRLFLDEVEYTKMKAYRGYLQSLPDLGRLEIARVGAGVTPRNQ